MQGTTRRMTRVFITGNGRISSDTTWRSCCWTRGWSCTGFDGMTDYYDVSLKARRHQMLLQSAQFHRDRGDAGRCQAALDSAVDSCAHRISSCIWRRRPGVRYSLENPRAYIEANVVGTFNVMEAAKRHEVRHLLMASTSSVYGAETDMPYTETHEGRHADDDLRRHQEGDARRWGIPMPICGTCRPRCSGFSRSTAPGDGRTWRISNLLMPF